MTELDNLVAAAFASQGSTEHVNKVYLTFLRSVLFLPVAKNKNPHDEEPFRPLFTKVDDNYFVLVFDTLEKLKVWSGEQYDEMNYVEISGQDLVSGINDNVYLCLNYGTEFYKEFPPDEVQRLKKIVARIEQMKPSDGKS